jgi:hypothetical protein
VKHDIARRANPPQGDGQWLGERCDDCASITTKFERDVAREMWGDARNGYNAPSRHKTDRKTHIILPDTDVPGRRIKVP